MAPAKANELTSLLKECGYKACMLRRGRNSSDIYVDGDPVTEHQAMQMIKDKIGVRETVERIKQMEFPI
jgi:hypothetical protein